MDNPEPQFTPQPESGDLHDRYDALQYLVTSMLGLLTLLAAVLAAFLWRQQSDKGFELGNFSVQATNFIAQYERGPGPAQQEFVRKITDYGRSHPDFLPVLAKYGLKPTAATTGASPATSAPPASKK
jgi:hypothetical protein